MIIVDLVLLSIVIYGTIQFRKYKKNNRHG